MFGFDTGMITSDLYPLLIWSQFEDHLLRRTFVAWMVDGGSMGHGPYRLQTHWKHFFLCTSKTLDKVYPQEAAVACRRPFCCRRKSHHWSPAMRDLQLPLNQTQKVRLQVALRALQDSPSNPSAIVTVADTIPVGHEDGILKYASPFSFFPIFYFILFCF